MAVLETECSFAKSRSSSSASSSSSDYLYGHIRFPTSYDVVFESAQISSVKKQWANMFRGECLWQAALATTYPLANQAKRWLGPIPRGLSKR
ncbi:hypothetical protein CerSpe_275810 [Prunus speciosa]